MPTNEIAPAPVKRKRGRPRKIQEVPAPVVVAPAPKDDLDVELGTPFKYETVGEKKDEFAAVPEPTNPVPRNHTRIFNRLREQYSTPFDGIPVEFGPNEYQDHPTELANFLAANSVIAFAGPVAIRALVLQGKKGYSMPFKNPRPKVEMIDRSVDPNPIGRGTGGLKTTPKVITLGEWS